MKKNIGTKDRIIRLALAILLLIFAWWQESWIIFGLCLFLFYEALVGWCLGYQILGKNSCPIERDK